MLLAMSNLRGLEKLDVAVLAYSALLPTADSRAPNGASSLTSYELHVLPGEQVLSPATAWRAWGILPRWAGLCGFACLLNVAFVHVFVLWEKAIYTFTVR